MGTMSTKFQTDIAQNEGEILWFLELLRQQKVASYLEIGSRYGGSLWRVASVLPPGARLVAVDFPDSAGGRSDSLDSLTACVAELCAGGYDAHVIFGDSTDPTIVEQVRAFGPFDCCFIDANHSLPFVTLDWSHYGPMARMVAFHDIRWRRAADWVGRRIDVPLLWDGLKRQYRHAELMLEKKNNGIGVLWRT